MKRRILIAVIVALLAGIGYAVWHYNNSEQQQSGRFLMAIEAGFDIDHHREG